MISRKVRRSGNGLVVGVPKEVLEDLNIKEGVMVNFTKEKDGYKLSVEVNNDEEIISLAREISEEYKITFEKLVER